MGDKVAGREAKVLYEYEKENFDELTLKIGDIIRNVTPVQDVDGWCQGELNGIQGMFPSNFVEFLPNSQDVDEHQPTADAGSVNVAGRKAIARFAYEATAEDELTLEIDDVVDVITEVEPGWWQGKLKGKTGVFPDNFCELLPEEKPSAKTVVQRDLADRPPAPLPVEPVSPATHHAPQDDQIHATESQTKAAVEDAVDSTTESQTEDDKRRSRFGGMGFGNIISQDVLSGKKLRKVEKKVPTSPDVAPATPEKNVAPIQSKEEDKDDKRKRKAPPAPPSGKKPADKAKVRHDYTPQNDDELRLTRGDIIVVINKEVLNTDGWWEGELNGKVGLFPENFVELIASDQEEKKKEPPPLPTGPKKTAGAPLLSSQAEKKPSSVAPTPSSMESPPLPVEPKKPALPTSSKPSLASKPALPNKKPVPPKPEGKKPEFPKKNILTPGKKLPGPPGPPEPAKKQLPVPPAKAEKTATMMNHDAVNVTAERTSTGELNLDEIGPTETLTHLTANRAKIPQKAPPSRYSRISEGRLSADLEKEDGKKLIAVIEPASETKEPAWKREVKAAKEAKEVKEAKEGIHAKEAKRNLELKPKKSFEKKVTTSSEEKNDIEETVPKEPEKSSTHTPSLDLDIVKKLTAEISLLRNQMQAMEKRHRDLEKNFRLEVEMLTNDVDDGKKNIAALKIEIDRMKKRESIMQSSVGE